MEGVPQFYYDDSTGCNCVGQGFLHSKGRREILEQDGRQPAFEVHAAGCRTGNHL